MTTIINSRGQSEVENRATFVSGNFDGPTTLFMSYCTYIRSQMRIKGLDEGHEAFGFPPLLFPSSSVKPNPLLFALYELKQE
jgi:hypothetical protein